MPRGWCVTKRAHSGSPSLTHVRSAGRFIKRRVGFINEFYLARLNLSAAALRNVETVASPVSPAVNAATVELKFAKAEASVEGELLEA